MLGRLLQEEEDLLCVAGQKIDFVDVVSTGDCSAHGGGEGTIKIASG